MKNELIFKNYSQEEIDNLLSTPLSKKIKSVKVKRWVNTKTKQIYYGLDVVGESGNVCGLCEDNRAVIFEDKKTANMVCKKMIEQLKSVVALRLTVRIGDAWAFNERQPIPAPKPNSEQWLKTYSSAHVAPIPCKRFVLLKSK
jgi:hypothetical protein